MADIYTGITVFGLGDITGAVVTAAATQNVAAPGLIILTGGEFNTVPATITSGNVSPLQLDSAGNLLVNVKAGGTSGTVAQGSTTSGQTGMMVQGAVTTAAPTYTTAQTDPLSLTTAGGLRVAIDQINDAAVVTGNGTNTGALRVAIASDNTAFSVNATLSAETTKVIGTVNVAAAQTIAVTQGTAANLNAAVVGTKTNNNAVPGATNIGALTAVANAAAQSWTETDMVLLSVDLAGNLRTTTVLGAGAAVIGHVITDATSVTTATLSAETTKVIGTTRTLGNIGGVFDQVAGTASPANVLNVGGNDGTNLQSIRTTTNRSVVMIPANEALAASLSYFSFDSGITMVSLTATENAIFSIKANSASKVFTIRGFELSGNGTIYRWRLLRDVQTLTGATFATTPSGSSALIDTVATTFTLGTGTVVDSGFVSSGQVVKPLTLALTNGAPGTDTYTLACSALTSSTAKCLVALQWTESAAAL
jgi:hypothetical protein